MSAFQGCHIIKSHQRTFLMIMIFLVFFPASNMPDSMNMLINSLFLVKVSVIEQGNLKYAGLERSVRVEFHIEWNLYKFAIM